MDPGVVFQLTASTIASICCGASLTFWLLSIKAMSLQRLRKEPLIASQAVIGGFVFLGSIASIALAFLEVNLKDDLPWPILSQEIGSVLLLLVLNEYLCISTLQPCLAHMISALLFMGTVAILSLSMYLPEHRNTLFSSFLIVILASLSFVYAQIIRAWATCMRPWHMQTSTFKLFWRCPYLTTARHQRALWAASIGSIGLFLFLLGLTILACIQSNLQTQIATLQIAIVSLRKAVVSFCLFLAPENDVDVLLSHEHIQQ